MAGISQPLQLFGDFGFSGGEDVAPNPLQDNQTCINWYAEVNKQNAKEVLGLLACPGLVQLVAAPGGGVPTVGVITVGSSLTQVFETAMTSPTWPTTIYGSSPQNAPVILSVSPTIDVIDRNFAATNFAGSAGDGNVYHYSNSTGALSSTSLQSAAVSTYQNWQLWTNNWAATWQRSDSSNHFRPFFIMATTDGNNIFAQPNAFLSNLTDFVSNSSSSWPNSTFVFDFGKLLNNTSGFSTADAISQVFPCADFKHVLVITFASGPLFKWALINCLHGSEAVVSHGTINDVASQSAFNHTASIVGGSNSIAMNNATSGSTGVAPMGCLQSDLQNLWVMFYNRDGNGGGSPNLAQFVVLQINQSTLDLKIQLGLTVAAPNSQGTNAFPSSNAAHAANLAAAIWADNGVCAMLCGQQLTVWTYNSAATAAAWPAPSTVTSLPVRGLWELPNDNTALAVIGNTCYLVTLANAATPNSFATLALTSVGTLLTTVGPVSIRDDNIGGYAAIVDGPFGYTYNISTRAFARITDPAFLGADTVAFIDGWWIFNQPGTQTFYTNVPQYSITFNASFFALKDSSADNLRAVFENKEQLWLLGDKTTEVWYDAGGQYFGFQRLVGTPLQVGCKAAHSVSRFSSDGQDGIIWFGRSERGENVIVRTRGGFIAETITTPAFSAEVAQYPITSDAIGYTYQEDTHEFYVLTFPTADVTWCFDSQSGFLHKRLSYDPYLQQFHRHRSNCFMNFQGMRIVGDYQCGSLFQLTRNVQTDAGWPLLARRRSPHVWDKGQRGRTFMASLQADFRPGVGTPSGLGSNPQARLRISRDGGLTFGQQWPAPIGQIGQYKTRTMWRKLGFGRDNVLELEVIDPVPRDLVGVTLKAFSAA